MNPLNRPRSSESLTSGEPLPLATELEFTRVYRENLTAHPALRELRCLAVYWNHLITRPKSGDLFLGRVSYPAVGFSPQPKGFGYYCQRGEVLEIARKTEAPPEWHARVADMLRFWEHETTQFKTRAAYPEWVAEALPTDDLAKVRPGFPLYRLAGTQLDYPRLLARGLPGMREDVENSSVEDPDLKRGLTGVLDLMAGLVPQWCALVRQAPMDISEEVAGGMEGALTYLPRRAPETFREGCQLFWLTSVLSGSWNYGRLDVALGPFLARDLEVGRITEETAVQWTESLFRLMDRAHKWDHRLTLGGLGRPQ